MLFYPILASIYIKISWDRSWNFALSRDKKLHISGHGGVSYKKKLQWQKPPKKKKKKKKKIMLFVLRKGRSKYAEQNKPWSRIL